MYPFSFKFFKVTFKRAYIGTMQKAPIGPPIVAAPTTKNISVIGWIFIALPIIIGTTTLPFKVWAIINNILTTKSGSFTKKFLNWFSNGRFFNDNMFGIVNFGEIDYKEIHSNGEVMQNIYEAEGGMPWTQQVTTSSSANLHSDVNPPEFTIELKDKSPWDVLNVCASSSLD